MSHRSKSGWKQSVHQAKQRRKRSIKRKKQALIAAGYLKKGAAPQPQEAAN